MSKTIESSDSRPWYRQFWPWFLILLPASVVVAGLSTLYIANRHADDLVVDDYYKDGLAINRRLEKQQRARDLGISAALQVSGLKVVIQLVGAPASSDLSLRLSHPLEADRDVTLQLYPLPAGLYEANLPAPVGPRWHWIVEQTNGTQWRLDGVLTESNFAHARTD